MDTLNTGSGGCLCGHVRYKTQTEPMIVHACHCRDCQKLSGGAFAINALYEADRVSLVSGETEDISVPTPSGVGQRISRCPMCKVAVWSNYNMNGLRELIRFVRVGTLDDPDRCPPDVHIFTRSKQPWVGIPDGAMQADTFYAYDATWTPESLQRRRDLLVTAGLFKSR